LRTECSSNEDLRQKTQRFEAKNNWSNTFDGCVKTIAAPKTVRYRFDNQFENCKLMNQKFTKESLEEKMERVALRTQKILERKQEKARKFMTPRVARSESENGWEKRKNGWIKKFEPTSEESQKSRSGQRAKYSVGRKHNKESLDEKMQRVALRKQKILERKQERARKFMTPRQDGFQILDDLSNQVDKVAIFELPKPSQFV
jgi:hypothetical protein